VWIGRWCSKTGHTGWLLVLLDEDVLASRNDGADADKDDGEAALSAAARERALLGPLGNKRHILVQSLIPSFLCQ